MDEIVDAAAANKLDENAFKLFRNGYVIKQILDLEKTLPKKGRAIETAEIQDKITALTSIPDIAALVGTFAHDDVIKGLISKNNADLTRCVAVGTFFNLPSEVINVIAEKLTGKDDSLKNIFEVHGKNSQTEQQLDEVPKI